MANKLKGWLMNVGEVFFSRIVIAFFGLAGTSLLAYCLTSNNSIANNLIAKAPAVEEAALLARTANEKVDKVMAAQTSAAMLQADILKTLKDQAQAYQIQSKTYQKQADAIQVASQATAVAIGRMDEHLTSIDKRVDRVEDRQDKISR